jgi:hypothetical protein
VTEDGRRTGFGDRALVFFGEVRGEGAALSPHGVAGDLHELGKWLLVVLRAIRPDPRKASS